MVSAGNPDHSFFKNKRGHGTICNCAREYNFSPCPSHRPSICVVRRRASGLAGRGRLRDMEEDAGSNPALLIWETANFKEWPMEQFYDDLCCMHYEGTAYVLEAAMQALEQVEEHGFLSLSMVNDLAIEYKTCGAGINLVVGTFVALGILSVDRETNTMFKGPLFEEAFESYEYHKRNF